jgi:hypothetical protein
MIMPLVASVPFCALFWSFDSRQSSDDQRLIEIHHSGASAAVRFEKTLDPSSYKADLRSYLRLDTSLKMTYTRARGRM